MSAYEIQPVTLQEAFARFLKLCQATGVPATGHSVAVHLAIPNAQAFSVKLDDPEDRARLTFGIELVHLLRLQLPNGHLDLTDLGGRQKATFGPSQPQAPQTYLPTLTALSEAFPPWHSPVALRDALGVKLSNHFEALDLQLARLTTGLATGATSLSDRLTDLGDRYAIMEQELVAHDTSSAPRPLRQSWWKHVLSLSGAQSISTSVPPSSMRSTHALHDADT